MKVQLPLLMAKSAFWLSVLDILSCSGTVAGLRTQALRPQSL